MADQAIQYRALIHKVEKIIDNANQLGMATAKYQAVLDNIIYKTENNASNNTKTKGEYASMFLTQDYSTGIKELRQLELALLPYNTYFRALKSSEYLDMQISKLNDKEQVRAFAKEVIMSINAIRNSNTLYYSDEKKVVEKVYDTAYQVIKLELITLGESEVYNYCKNYEVDTYYFDMCIKKEMEQINLNDNKYIRIREKKLFLEKEGISGSYFDEELIKLLVCFGDNNDLRTKIIDNLNDMIQRINENVLEFQNAKRKYTRSEENLKSAKSKYNELKRELILRISYLLLVGSITLTGAVGIHKLSKKLFTSNHYEKEIITYSQYGTDTEKGYANLDDKEKVYLNVYGLWEYNSVENIYVREVDKYDVSHIKLGTIEEYLNLDIDSLGLSCIDDVEYALQNNIEPVYVEEYVGVEKEVIDRTKEVPITSDVFIAANIVMYMFYIGILFDIYFHLEDSSSDYAISKHIRIIKEIFKGNYRDSIFDERSTYIEKIKKVQEEEKNLLELINKNKDLREKFNKLFEENKFLLDNPQELYSKIDELSDSQYIKEIKGKVKTRQK